MDKKISVKISPKIEQFEKLINLSLESGFDIYITDNTTTAYIYFKKTGYAIKLYIDGTWEIE